MSLQIINKTKEGIKRGNKGRKTATKHNEDKQQNANSISFPMSNYFKCKWINLLKRQIG